MKGSSRESDRWRMRVSLERATDREGGSLVGGAGSLVIREFTGRRERETEVMVVESPSLGASRQVRRATTGTDR